MLQSKFWVSGDSLLTVKLLVEPYPPIDGTYWQWGTEVQLEGIPGVAVGVARQVSGSLGYFVFSHGLPSITIAQNFVWAKIERQGANVKCYYKLTEGGSWILLQDVGCITDSIKVSFTLPKNKTGLHYGQYDDFSLTIGEYDVQGFNILNATPSDIQVFDILNATPSDIQGFDILNAIPLDIQAFDIFNQSGIMPSDIQSFDILNAIPSDIQSFDILNASGVSPSDIQSFDILNAEPIIPTVITDITTLDLANLAVITVITDITTLDLADLSGSLIVLSADPSFGVPDQTLDVLITGEGFQDTAIVGFSGNDITVNSTTFISPTLLQSNITISNIAILGLRDIIVTNFGGDPSVGVDLFEVVSLAPVVTLANPSNGNQDTTLDVSIVGQYFQSGATVEFSGTGITVNGVVGYIDTEHLTVNITIEATADLTVRDITVTNPDTQFGVGLSLFTVTPGSPTVSKVLPAVIERGQTIDVEIFGSKFQDGSTAAFSGSGVTVNGPVIRVDEFQLIANITIEANAVLSTRDVTVTNIDTLFGVGLSLLEIIAFPPTIISIDPSFGTQGETVVDVIIIGTYFQDGSIVAFSGYGVTNILPGSIANFISSTQLQVTIAIASDAESTARSVYVTNPDFNQGIGTGLFTVNPLQPNVISVTPASVEQDSILDITINGTGFQAGSTVEISGTGVIITSLITFINSTQLSLSISVSAIATLGLRSITVTNPNTTQDTGIDILTVTSPLPRITSVTPATGYQGDILDLIILGEYFQSGAVVNFSGTGIIVEFTNYISSTRLDARINIASDAFISKRDIFIKNPGENVSVSLEAFEVIPLPITVDSIDPVTGRQGEDLLNVQIVGTNFQAGAIVEFSGAGISVTSISSVTATKIQCDLSIASDSIPSVRDVIVRNLDSGEGTGIDLFTVTSLPPEVLSVDPTEIERDQTVDIDVIGTRFYGGATVVFSGTGITTNLVTWVSSELLTVNITLASDTLLDLRDVTVANVDLQEHTGLALLEIIAFPPTLLSILPTSAVRNESHLLTLTGTYFQDGAKVEINDIGMVGPVTALFIDSATLRINIFIPAEAVLGLRDVTVINPDNKQSMVEDLFEVVALAPLIANVSPASNSRGQSLDVVITGSYFQDGAIAIFSGTGITINGLITVDNSSQISANISIDSSATLGLRDVTVTNPDTQSGTGTNLFEITALNPVISGIVPFESERSVTLGITVHGSYFQSGIILTSLGPGITINSSTYVDSNRFNANITIAVGAILGFREAFVTNLDGGSGSRVYVFKVVEGSPTVTSIDPIVGGRSQTIVGSVFGSNFQDGAVISFSGEGITLDETTFVDSSQIDITFTVAFDSELTARDITVLNPDGKQAIGIGLFTVTILGPVITSVIPALSNRGKTLDAQIIGANFQFNPIVIFSSTDIEINSIVYVNNSQLTANITIDPNAVLGLRDVTVTNIDGGIGIGLNVFEVSTISISSINPTEGKQGEVLGVSILGDGFQQGALARFSGTDIAINSTTFISETELIVSISISEDAELTLRDATVTNLNGEIFTLIASFNITGLAPIITTVTPKYGKQGSNITVSCSGYYFQPGASISFSDTGITVVSTAYIDRNYLSANIIIDPVAPMTSRDVTVTNPDTQSNLGIGLFTVTKDPEIFQVSPNSGKQGENLIVDILGEYFQDGTIVAFSGGDISVKEVIFINSSLLQVELAIAEKAALTLRDVTVTNQDGFKGVGIGLFAVTPSYSYILELDSYDKWGLNYTREEKDILNDFYQQLVFLLIDEHIYDTSKAAVGYKDEKYLFTGRFN
ncbi:MAG: hypothetical protein KJ648_06885 [Candidatus Omnitrophica bacterium]|nr:hypothetical protein [Candidatus Omnitrophota bacterium]